MYTASLQSHSYAMHSAVERMYSTLHGSVYRLSLFSDSGDDPLDT